VASRAEACISFTLSGSCRQALDVDLQRGDGRAQLVRGVGQEALLPVVALVEPVEGAVHGIDQRPDLAGHIGQRQPRGALVHVDALGMLGRGHHALQAALHHERCGQNHAQAGDQRHGRHQEQERDAGALEGVAHGQRAAGLRHHGDRAGAAVDALEPGLGPGAVGLGADGHAVHAVEGAEQLEVLGRDLAVAQLGAAAVAHDEPERRIGLLQALQLGRGLGRQLAVGAAHQRALDGGHGLLPGLVDHAPQRPGQAQKAAHHQQADHHLQQDQAPDEPPAQRQETQPPAHCAAGGVAAQIR
jgi:hypothetical protein